MLLNFCVISHAPFHNEPRGRLFYLTSIRPATSNKDNTMHCSPEALGPMGLQASLSTETATLLGGMSG